MKKSDIEVQPVDLPGGGKASIQWNRPLWQQGADARRPLRLEVAVEVRQPGSTGMPEGVEVTALDNLNHSLSRLVARRGRGVEAMSVTGAGRRTFIFYLPATAGPFLRKRDTRQVLGPALARLQDDSGYELDVAWHDDPDWRRLVSLFSHHDPEQWGMDRAQMVQMAKAGDAIHARRQVAHRVSFNADDGCRDFLREARRMRFKPEGGPKRSKKRADRLIVVIERQEPTLATWHLHPVVLSVKAIANHHGGSYEGWEAELVPSLVPPPLTAPRGG